MLLVLSGLLGGALLGCGSTPLPPSTGGVAPPSAPPAPVASAKPVASAAVEVPVAAPPPPAAPARVPGVFDVHAASKQYDFRLAAPPVGKEEEECSGAGDLVVLLRGTPTETQRIHLDHVCVVLDEDGGLLVNTAKPEEDQGTIVVDDFDFDGREDLAVQVSHLGSYGGPTFRVFLGQDTPGRFAFSPELSNLGGLGLFQVDHPRRRLVTQEKSGCCFHVATEHVVVKGLPQKVFSRSETLTPEGDLLIETKTLVKGRWLKTSRRQPATE